MEQTTSDQRTFEMKRCTYCGKEYPDDATSCPIDTHPLERIAQGEIEEKFSARDEPEPFRLPGLLKLKASERNNGLCLVWKCPKCSDLAEFYTISGKAKISVIGLDVSEFASTINLRCSKCRYELSVSRDEQAWVAKLTDLTRQLLEEKITSDTYQRTIKDTPATFVKTLLALSQNWKCPTCGEENPVSFELCWNCASRENPHPDVNDENAKPFPAMPRGGNAWE